MSINLRNISTVLAIPLVLSGIMVCTKVVAAKMELLSQSKVLGESTTFNPSPSGSVLAATKSTDEFLFSINVPASFVNTVKFSDTVEFLQDIIAPNIVSSLTSGKGINISSGQNPTITNTGVLSLQSKTGELNLTAGDGITLDGLKITNSGILSLTAGTNISIDGNKITNTYEAPAIDYGLSGWTDSGSTVNLTTTTDSVVMDTITFGNAMVTNGKAVVPSVDLGADLGSSSKRFNNLWVANINSNSSQSFSGQTTFSYAPTDTTISQASILINPTTSATNGQLLGLGIAGYQRALIDKDGDIVLGYNSATSAPTTDYPLNIYGHNGTRVSYTDTSGNSYFAGNVGIGTTAPLSLFQAGKMKYDDVSTGTLTVGGDVANIPNGNGSLVVKSINNLASITFTPYGSYIDTSSSKGLEIRRGGNNIFNFGNASNDNVTYTGTGNVGIGTTNPLSALHVAGTTGIAWNGGGGSISYGLVTIGNAGSGGSFLVNTPSLSSDWSSGLGINGSFSSTRSVININAYGVKSGAYGSDLAFSTTRLGSLTEAMRIDTNGNVGIGTTNPGSLLTVGNANSQFQVNSSGNIALGGGTFYSNAQISTNLGGGYFTVYSQVPADSGLVAIKGYNDISVPLIVSAGNGQTKDIQQWKNYSGSTLAIINSSGNIGIGTTSPLVKLQVNGPNAAISSSAVNGAFIIQGQGDVVMTAGIDDNVGNFWIQPRNKVAPTNYYATLFNPLGGNVGIGTTSPTSKLDISTTTGLNALQITNSSAATNKNWIFYPVTNGSSTDLRLYDNSDRITFQAGGNVGIGTTNPQRKLDVNGVIYSSIAESNTISEVNSTLAGNGAYWWLQSDASHRFNIGVYNSGSKISGLTVDQNGYVGIGTTSPGSKLHVNGNIEVPSTSRIGVSPGSSIGSGFVGIDATDNAFKIAPRSNNAHYFNLSSDGSLALYGVGANSTIIGQYNIGQIQFNQNGNIDFNLATQASTVATILTNGNFGIGTISPTGKLHVSGAVTGKALAIFDETGNQALFTASSSGTTKFTVNKNGLVNSTAGGLATYTKAGTISDSDFTDTAVDGLFGFDTTNHRLYFREGAAWSYIAKTGGFQIPNFEAEGLAKDDFLIPYVESTMSDGAVHGLYKKFSDVKSELLSDIYKLIKDFGKKFVTKQSISEQLCVGTEENKTCLNKEQIDQVVKTLPTPTHTPTPTPGEILPTLTVTPESTNSAILE